MSRHTDERRRHRRHAPVTSTATAPGAIRSDLGSIVDLSVSGLRLVTQDPSLKPGTSVDIRLRLPEHAGVRPFAGNADQDGGLRLRPADEWAGQLLIRRRIDREDGTFEIGGELTGISAIDRGMLGLYLSIQPVAA
jgi:hypothetical protein